MVHSVRDFEIPPWSGRHHPHCPSQLASDDISRRIVSDASVHHALDRPTTSDNARQLSARSRPPPRANSCHGEPAQPASVAFVCTSPAVGEAASSVGTPEGTRRSHRRPSDVVLRRFHVRRSSRERTGVARAAVLRWDARNLDVLSKSAPTSIDRSRLKSGDQQ